MIYHYSFNILEDTLGEATAILLKNVQQQLVYYYWRKCSHSSVSRWYKFPDFTLVFQTFLLWIILVYITIVKMMRGPASHFYLTKFLHCSQFPRHKNPVPTWDRFRIGNISVSQCLHELLNVCKSSQILHGVTYYLYLHTLVKRLSGRWNAERKTDTI